MAQDGRERELVDYNARHLMACATRLLALAESESLSDEKLIDLRAAVTANDTAKVAFALERLMAQCDVSDGFKRESSVLLMQYARQHSVAGRSWFSPMGFDSKPSELVDVANLLAAS
jgi:hypothetical protein